ncbi:unnamed protein product [Candida verbasci]|uniref:Topoisomerase 1-associated factor 1 n=1 Tax=Candida verbasci TaxID=1227364 RepID=A0A9W4XBS2_9ASCO|nr:unnamed protein product [Candida verbasci]
MSDIEQNTENYHDTEEFDDFIEYSEDELQQENNEESKSNQEVIEIPSDEQVQEDRIRQLTTTLKPNETETQKVLRAHISVLVSALGGPDHTSTLSPPPYRLGQDALACLKDLKRWIKSVDEKKNCYDVALACFTTNLVTNDLIVILCQWEQDMSNKVDIRNKITTEKIMLSCLELLVLLTWPVEFSNALSEDQKLEYAEIKKAHLVYKKFLLNYNKGQVLKACLRLVKPIIVKSRMDREPRDNQILKLVLYLFRNILAIEPATLSVAQKASKWIVASKNLPSNVTQDEISINSLLSVFKKNKVFMLILTISSNIGFEFDKDIFGEICLECVYLLLKGLELKDMLPLPQRDSTSIDSTEPLPLVSTLTMQLEDLVKKETKLKTKQTQNISTRHGRFGSLLSIRSNDANTYVISGQEALYTTDSSLDKLDKSKKWTNRSTFKYDSDEYVSKSCPVYLNIIGRDVLTEFLDQFLSGGCFNNLIECMASKLTSSSDLSTLDELSMASYFYTIAWFLKYEREKTEKDSSLNYGSIGGALSEINFILIISYFRKSYELKNWNSLHVAMICFRELLQISNSIFGKRRDEVQNEIDRELAEGIMRKLFSFNDILNIVVHIPQTASKHSPNYLRVSISVVHIILKAFETFANEDIQLYIQTKRKRNKNHKKRINDLDRDTENMLRDVIEGSGDEFEDQIKQVTRERKINYKDTEIRFFHQSIVTTYIEFLSRYEDLTDKEIKMCLSYFHRVFIKRKDYSGLFRLDFMQLLQKLRNHLQRGSSLRLQVEEFIYHFNKKFKLALERFPNPIEILFPRFEDTASRIFLSTGELYEKPEAETRGPRLAKDLEFVRSFDLDNKIKILISQLHLQQKQLLIKWLISELDRIINLRNLDSEAICELYPTREYRRLIINNGYLRLLIKMIGFELPYTMDENPELGKTDVAKLAEIYELIKKWDSSQPVLFEDDKEPSYFLRTKESSYDEDDNEYEGDFVVPQETVDSDNNSGLEITKLDQLEELEKRLSNSEKGSRDKGKPKRVSKPKPRKPVKPRKEGEKIIRRRFPKLLEDDSQPVRSSEFIHDSDNESDDEKDNAFFEREERLRKLISESGGIVSAEQLSEFKKIWSKLENSTNKSKESVAYAMKEVALYAQNEDDKEKTLNEKNAIRETSAKLSDKDAEEEFSVDPSDKDVLLQNESDDSILSDNEVSSNTSIESKREARKRSIDEGLDERIKRKKRIIMDDDD